MQTNILWTGKEYSSMENCILTEARNSIEIDSTIIGSAEGHIFKVEYRISTNATWETTLVTLKTQFRDAVESNRLEKRDGYWFLNERPVPDFKDICDVDISLTPFTNSLPIRRLQFKSGERQKIEVIYFDLLERTIQPAIQFYTRESVNKYIFENADGSFKKTITVDESRLVENYPELFMMTHKLESNYQLP